MVHAGPLTEQFLNSIEPDQQDILLVDRYEDDARLAGTTLEAIHRWQGPVLHNDATITEVSLRQGDVEFGRRLAGQLNAQAAGLDSRPVEPVHTF